MIQRSASYPQPGKTKAGAARAKTAPYGIEADLAPMEAKAVSELPVTGQWQFEPKWDGFRCLAFKAGEHVQLRAKSGKSLGRYFPEILSSMREVDVERFVVDGELVIAIDGQFSFDALQMRLHPAESRIRKLSQETPATLILFDLLVDPKGTVLLEQPLSRRRQVLESLRMADQTDRFDLSPFTLDRSAAERWLNASNTASIDGVVAKHLDGPYLPGQRAMLKIKLLRTADCVVGGFRYASGKKEVGSLLLGLYDQQGELDHVGFTATITGAERPALTRRLEQLRQTPGFTGRAPGGPSRWSTDRSADWIPLAPKLVVEVRYDQVTNDRFRHGTKLLRWRPDKAPRQCTFDQIRTPI
jgi:ATP-dependent DNA ligase